MTDGGAIDRRDFLTAWIQLLLLALFPWMRVKPEMAEAMASEMVATARTATGGGWLTIWVNGATYQVFLYDAAEDLEAA
jgi:hypothetical protein